MSHTASCVLYMCRVFLFSPSYSYFYAGMPMPAASASMPMPSYATEIHTLFNAENCITAWLPVLMPAVLPTYCTYCTHFNLVQLTYTHCNCTTSCPHTCLSAHLLPVPHPPSGLSVRMHSACLSVRMHSACQTVRMHSACLTVRMHSACLTVRMHSACLTVRMHSACLSVRMHVACLAHWSTLTGMHHCIRNRSFLFYG